MTDETTHIATAAALLADPYAALNQHLHGDGDDTWRTRALAAEAEVERLGRVMQEIASANYPACPFDRSDCQVAPDEPCPVCGDKNTLDQVSQCASLGASAVARAALAEGDPR